MRPKQYFSKSSRDSNTCTKTIFCSETSSSRTSSSISRAASKSLILDCQNPTLRKMKSPTLTVEVLSIWHPKCLLSNFLFYVRSGHSYQVDYYALGILLYELLFGRSPFYAPKKEDIFFSILNSEPKFPKSPNVSK